MKLQNLTIIFIIIILPIVLVLSAYIGYEIKTINKQNAYNNGLVTATHDAIFAFELNTKNDMYANNAENKRSNIKASIKTFENSLSTACNLGLYNNEAIEEYIPAIVFGLYDGFYMYSPTQTQGQGYKHELRNYVYYSEEIKEGDIDIVIRYTLDNYVAVSGKIGNDYVTRAGYLLDLKAVEGFYSYDVNKKNADAKIGEANLNSKFMYKGVPIKNEEYLKTYKYDEEKKQVVLVNATNGEDHEVNNSAINYFKESIAFSEWFKYWIGKKVDYLNIDKDNDPENEKSDFVKHKREIMKEKIEGVLNSSITAYANKSRNNYKMPKFLAEDWDKIYNNISVITFVQGMNIGFKNYNNYCILNSTNNQEYVNPNLIYFSDETNYHDIRCEEIQDKETTGYKIGSFEKVKYEETDEQGKTETYYYYKHNELACYKCINGNVSNTTNIYEYVTNLAVSKEVRTSYFTSLARERYKTTKLLNSYNKLDKIEFTLTFDPNAENVENMPKSIKVNKGEAINLDDLEEPRRSGYDFAGWSTDKNATEGAKEFENYSITKDTTLYAIWNIKKCKLTLHYYENNVETIQIPQHQSYTIKVPVRTGYNFAGWFYGDGSGPVTVIENPGEDDIDLYARWSLKKYTITLDYNDGSGRKNTTTLDYDSQYTLPSDVTGNVAKTYFNGWSTNKNATEGNISNITVKGDKTYYATWITGVVAKKETTYYATLQDAINTSLWPDSTTIYLLEDTTENISLPGVRKIDLGGHILNGNINNNHLSTYSTASTIINGTVNGYIKSSNTDISLPTNNFTLDRVNVNVSSGEFAIYTSNVNMSLTNCRITAGDAQWTIKNEKSIVSISDSNISTNKNVIYNSGTILDAGRINLTNSNVNTEDGIAISNDKGTVNIDGGTIASSSNSTIQNSSTLNISGNSNIRNNGNGIVINSNKGTITIDNGTVETGNNHAIYSSGSVTINGGDVKNNSSNPTIQISSTLTISGNSDIKNNGNGIVINSNKGTITIDNGTVQTGNNHAIYSSGSVTINGGDVKNNSSSFATIIIIRTEFLGPTLNINGGTIKNNKANAYEICPYTTYKFLGIWSYPTVNGGDYCRIQKEGHP